MMKARKNFCFILTFMLLLVLVGGSSAYAAGAGTLGAPFLEIGGGVRAMGMGGAFCAVADDASAIYWNPAGLTNIPGRQIVAAYTQWFADIGHTFLGYAQSLDEDSALGAGLIYLGATDTERDEWGDEKGLFQIVGMAPIIGYARKLNSKMAIGGSVKYVSQTLADESAGGFAFDIGGLYRTAIENVTLGLSIRNVGAAIKSNSGEDPFPQNNKLGVAYRIAEDLTVALDINVPSVGQTYICMGGEYWIADTMALRLGYRTGPSEEGIGITLGAGFRGEWITLDYAFVPYGDLGNTHRISLGMEL